MMKKKSQVEIQFNWIFVVVVGAIIMIFFVSIVLTQKDSSEVKINEKVLDDLEAIFVSAKVSTKTTHVVNIPYTDLLFDCEDCNCRFYIGGTNKIREGKLLQDDIIFAPGSLKGTQLVTWTYDWSAPFRVTNFLFLTNPSIKYVVVNGTDDDKNKLAQLLYDSLPDEINKEMFQGNPVDYPDYNDDEVRFVGFEESVLELPDYEGRSVGIYVIGDNVKLGQAKVVIKELGRVVDYPERRFIGEGLLYAMIFSKDPESYQCLLKTALKRLNFVSQVYESRTKNLGSYFGGLSSRCYFRYDMAARDFQSIIEATSDLNAVAEDEVLILVNAFNALEFKNTEAERLSCPVLY